MNWHVEVASATAKFLKRIPHKDADRLRQALRAFAIDPFAGDIIKLGGEKNSWRKRVGFYRIFFAVFDEQRTVLIQDIRRRGSKTY